MALFFNQIINELRNPSNPVENILEVLHLPACYIGARFSPELSPRRRALGTLGQYRISRDEHLEIAVDDTGMHIVARRVVRNLNKEIGARAFVSVSDLEYSKRIDAENRMLMDNLVRKVRDFKI